MLLTEHNDDFNDDKMKKLVEECEDLSTVDLMVIPGLEVNCDYGRHILAVGIKKNIGTDSPDKVIDKIRENGGLVIFPHPGLYQFRPFFTSISQLNGVEVWNIRYDIKCAPSLKSFELLRELRDINPDIFAYGGQDLHSAGNFDDICLKVELNEFSEKEILNNLRRGKFRIERKRTRIDSTGNITGRQRLFFDMAASVAMLLKH